MVEIETIFFQTMFFFSETVEKQGFESGNGFDFLNLKYYEENCSARVSNSFFE